MRTATLCLVLLVLGLTGCSDNAVKLARTIEAAHARADGAPFETFTYTPRSGSNLPYYLIFFPAQGGERDDLVEAGLPTHLAERIVSEMGYLDVGSRPFLVVARDRERLSFTTYWSRFASVPELLVVPATGAVTLALRTTESETHVEVVPQG